MGLTGLTKLFRRLGDIEARAERNGNGGSIDQPIVGNEADLALRLLEHVLCALDLLAEAQQRREEASEDTGVAADETKEGDKKN
jgi:hypothetical protein